MKRVNNLYDGICDLEKIIAMTDKVCSRTKNKNKVHNFTLYKFEHIYNIYKKLKTKNISLNNYNIFMINDPKCRIIMAQELEDNIINHLVLKLIAQTKTKIRKKVSKFNKIDSDDIESRNKIIRSLISYNGVLKWGNCKTLYYKYLYNCFNK